MLPQLTTNSTLLPFLGWFFIPNWITSLIHRAYYKAQRRPYNTNSPFVLRQRRNIYVAVIVAYLVYSVYQAYASVSNDPDPLEGGSGIYSLLGVSPNVDAKTLKAVFRRLTVKYHPDKVGSGSSSQAAEELWIRLKTGYDIVSNPVLRYGYDRFGGTLVKWLRDGGDDVSKAGLATIKEIVYKGVRNSLVYYTLSMMGAEAMAFFKVATVGRMWKSYIMISGLIAELWIMTRSSQQGDVLFLGLLPFQVIKVIRKLSIVILIGINQLGPQFQGSTQTLEAEMDHLLTLVDRVSKEVEQSVVIERAPFLNQLPGLKKKLTNAVVDNTISNDLEVVDALRTANK
jgi:hypothetical protein